MQTSPTVLTVQRGMFPSLPQKNQSLFKISVAMYDRELCVTISFASFLPLYLAKRTATKYHDCDIMLFWWLEKNKDLTTKQMVDELYSLICDRINDPITYKELKSKKLGLDTKGIIPVQV